MLWHTPGQFGRQGPHGRKTTIKPSITCMSQALGQRRDRSRSHLWRGKCPLLPLDKPRFALSPCSMQGMLNCHPLCKAKSTFVTMECKRPPMESSNKTIMPLPNSSPLVCFATAPNNHGHPSSPSGSSGLSAAHFFCARYHLDLLRRLLDHPSRQQG